MQNAAPVLFLLLRLTCMVSSHARNIDAHPPYETAYACEGKVLTIACREGELINLIRANYGRFSITICNDNGNTDWSVNCMSPRSLRVMHAKCALQHNCSIPASTSMFGDPCQGTLKYLEAHYRCMPATTTTTTSRPSPPWLITSQPSVWSTSKLATLRPPTHTHRTTETSAAAAAAAPSSRQPDTGVKEYHADTEMPEVQNPVVHTHSPDVASVDAEPKSRPPPAPPDEAHETPEPPSPVFTQQPAPAWKTSIRPTALPADLESEGPLSVLSTTTESWRVRHEGVFLDYCAPITVRNLHWNWTKTGDQYLQPCPGGSTGTARWRCVSGNSGAFWWGNSPDLSECRSVWLNSLDARIDDENDAITSIANDLAQVTNSNILYGGDLVTTSNIVKKMTDRMSESMQEMGDTSQREAIVTELLQAVERTTSNLLEPEQMPGWRDLAHNDQMRIATALLIGLEENAFLLADTVIRQRTVVQTARNVLLSVRVLRTSDLVNSEVFPEAGENEGDVGDLIVVPKGAMMDNSEGGLVRIVFFAFQRLQDVLAPIGDANENSVASRQQPASNVTRIVNSNVISASLGKGRHIQFNQWVHITFKHLRTENVTRPTCVFWDYTTSSWSEEGCMVEFTNRTHTGCKCNHLTNFALLMDVHANSSPIDGFLTLQVITYIGCIICIVCLLLAVIIFYLFRGLKSDRTTIHKNLCGCLLLAELLFLLGISQTDRPILCGFVAGFLHFVFLCAFAWMFLEGFQLYVMLVEALEGATSRVRWYYVFAYGTPLLIVGISCVVDPRSYGTDRYCWLRADNFFIFSFVGPVIAVILANLVFLSMAIYMMCRHSSTGVTLKSKEHSRLANARSWLRGAIVLVFLLALTWTFGLLYLNEESPIMAYLFAILNCLQGLFILFSHCIFNDKVRKEYRKWNLWLPKCLTCDPLDTTTTSVEGKDAPHSAVFTGAASNNGAAAPTGIPSGHVYTPHVPHQRADIADVPNGNSVGTNAVLGVLQSPRRTAPSLSIQAGRRTGLNGGAEILDDTGVSSSYIDRAATLGDVRRHHQYRHGSDRVLIYELERQNGARAATLHVAKRRPHRYGSDSRRGEGDDPVYEEIRQASSDVSDEELRRGMLSRQSLRSYGDHSPLIPSPTTPMQQTQSHSHAAVYGHSSVAGSPMQSQPPVHHGHHHHHPGYHYGGSHRGLDPR